MRRRKRDTNRDRLGGQNAQKQATMRDFPKNRQELAVADCRRMSRGMPQKHRRSRLRRAWSDNPLIDNDNWRLWRRASSGEAPAGCVFFTQHIPEIVRIQLWAGQFFVACRNSLVKVSVRRRGEPQVDSTGVFGEWKGQASFGD